MTNKFKILLTFALVLGFSGTNAQLITFEKEYYHDVNDNINNLYDFVQTADSGYLMGNLMRMVKIDKFGNLQWMKRFENPIHTLRAFSKFQNGYIASGTELIVKLDSIYNIEWLKIPITTSSIPYITKIVECTDGLIFLGSIDLGGDAGILIFKIDNQSNVIWSKVYRYSNTAAEFSGGLTVLNDKSMIVSGRTDSVASPDAFSDIILFKVDSVGTILWSKRFKNSIEDTYIRSHVVTQDSCIVLLVNSGLRNILIKTDINGNLIWSKHYSSGTYSRGYSIIEEQNGNLVFTGRFQDNDSIGFFDRAFLVTTDSMGNILETRGYSGSRFNYAGCVKKTFDSGYGLSTACLNTWGNNSFGFIKTDSLGYTANCGVDQPNFNVTNPTFIESNILLNDSIISISISNTTYTAPNIGTVYTFCSSIGYNEIDSQNNFSIHPNPSTGRFIVGFSFDFIGSLEIIDLNGKLIEKRYFDNESLIEIDISKKCTPGIYFVKFISEDAVKTQKIIITDY